MPDLSGLATRMPSDKGYARAAQKADAPSPNTFVCPRANAYGGREGIIPPAVAAVRGLVPKGMRHISVSDTARRANAARDSGVGEAEQYLEYYGQGAAQDEPQEPQKPQVRPEPVQAKKPAKATRAPKPAKASPPSAEGVLRDPDDPGMFSRGAGQSADDDTLDGFYDSLPSGWLGTGDAGSEVRKGSAARAARAARAATTVRAVKVGMDFGAGPSETVVSDVPEPAGRPRLSPAPLPRTEPPVPSADVYALSAAMAKLAEEKAELGHKVADLQERLRKAQAQLEEAVRSRHVAPEPEAETVRVALSAEEERLKVGGRGWECNVVGRLHLGRGGVSAVLTVSDPAYGSELLASVQPGEVVVLSSSARTSCTYAGHCVKIYGEADSQDFITMLQLGVVPDAGP